MVPLIPEWEIWETLMSRVELVLPGGTSGDHWSLEVGVLGLEVPCPVGPSASLWGSSGVLWALKFRLKGFPFQSELRGRVKRVLGGTACPFGWPVGRLACWWPRELEFWLRHCRVFGFSGTH